jgi:protein SFI1
MDEKIAQARENLVVRQALHRWRTLTASRRDLYQRVAATADNRRLRAALHVWHARLRERKQLKWRQDMRARMKVVRDKHDHQLVQDAWAQWRQAFRLRMSEQRYYQSLAMRFYKKWRLKLHQVDSLENKADHFVAIREKRQAARCWDLWKREMGLRRAESMLVESVGLRIMFSAMETWKRRMYVFCCCLQIQS